jgi:hypothetical protein
MTRRSQPAAVLLAGLALVGCQDPYTQGTTTAGDRPRPHERPQAEPPRGDELAPPAPAAATAAFRERAARRNARTVLEAFCWQWANWSWRTIERQQQRLARLATGPLAAELAPRRDRRNSTERCGATGSRCAVASSPSTSTRPAAPDTRSASPTSGRSRTAAPSSPAATASTAPRSIGPHKDGG